MAGRKITVEFLGEDKDLQKTLGNVESKSSSLSGILGKVGKVAAAGLAIGGAAAVAGGKHFFDLAATVEQMGQKADTVFGSQIGKVDKWAAANAHAMGLTRTQATGLAANFGDLLIPMGFTRKQAAGMSTDVVGLSGALSQWSGGTVSAAEASDILAKAMLGERDGLKALGISISEEDVKAELLRNGQDKLTGSALQQAKATATQTLIMQKSTDAQAAFAAGGSPLLSTQAQLKAKFGELQEMIATKLIPVFTTMADWFLTKGIPAIQTFGNFISTNVLPALQQMGESAQAILLPALSAIGGALTGTVLPSLKRLAEILNNNRGVLAAVAAGIAAGYVALTVYTVATKVAAAATAAWNVIQKVLNGTLKANPIGLVVTAIGLLAAGMVMAYQRSETFRNIVDKVAGFLRSNLVPAIQTAIGVLGQIISKVVSVGAAFVGGVADVAKFAAGVAQKVGNVIQFVSEIPGKILGALGAVGKTLYAAGSAIIQGLIDGIMAKVAVLKEKLTSVTNMIPDWKGPLDKDKILLKPAGEALIEGLISGIEKKKTKLQTVLEKITEHIKKEQDKLASLLDNRQSIVDSFKGFASSVFGADMGFEASADRQQKIQDLLERIKERRATGNEQDIADQKEIERLRSEGQEAPSRATADREKKIQDLLEKIKERQTTELDDADRKEIARLQAEDAAAPKGIDALMAAAATQRSKAETLNADVQALIAKGMSKDLINELIASGQSGMDQIHLLASATDEQIAALNANQAATQAALAAAGLAAADAVMGEQIAQAERDVKLADTIRDKLKELMEQQDKNTVIQVVLSGKTLHASLHKLKRETNRKLELD